MGLRRWIRWRRPSRRGNETQRAINYDILCRKSAIRSLTLSRGDRLYSHRLIIDCHVHISALTPGHGTMSQKLLNSIPFRFMQRRLNLPGQDAATERALEAKLKETIDATEKLDAVAVLAFDAVHDEAGRMDLANTHLYVTNDYVIELAQRHPKMLFGASVHPYRKDAVAELERCAVTFLQLNDFAQGRQIAIHGKDALGNDQNPRFR